MSLTSTVVPKVNQQKGDKKEIKRRKEKPQSSSFSLDSTAAGYRKTSKGDSETDKRKDAPAGGLQQLGEILFHYPIKENQEDARNARTYVTSTSV